MAVHGNLGKPCCGRAQTEGFGLGEMPRNRSSPHFERSHYSCYSSLGAGRNLLSTSGAKTGMDGIEMRQEAVARRSAATMACVTEPLTPFIVPPMPF
jgi:hypothetical protein